MLEAREEAEVSYCEHPECYRLAEHGHSLCPGHRKQKQRHGRIVSIRLHRYESPIGRALEASLALAEADSECDADYHRAYMRWLDAMNAFARWRVERLSPPRVTLRRR